MFNFQFSSNAELLLMVYNYWGWNQSICLPDDYVKFELPPVTPTYVSIGIDIKDIPKVSDKDFSVTLNAYFIVKWKDPRIIVRDSRNKSLSGSAQYKSMSTDHIMLGRDRMERNLRGIHSQIETQFLAFMNDSSEMIWLLLMVTTRVCSNVFLL